ncbi:MAG: hypothetical protein GYA18_03370 [Chloroflexi bacterium]|nr:hypothetical protein [Chloroflexota bacterium]
MNISPQDYYCKPGHLTDHGKFAFLKQYLPDDIPSLCKLIHNIAIHIFWAERMGCPLDEVRQSDVRLRSFAKKMERLFELDDATINIERKKEKKLVVNCRDISLIMTTFLRMKEIPARCRCGFATYFIPQKYEDHWICEYWDVEAQQWKMVDAQIDEYQKKVLKINFDVNNVPQGKFIPAGRAWQLIRQNRADPQKFGIFKYKGEMFIAGNMQRDLLALNSMELLPWDLWGYLDKRYIQLTQHDLKLLDEMAIITQLGDSAFPMVRNMFNNNPALHPKQTWLI